MSSNAEDAKQLKELQSKFESSVDVLDKIKN